MMIWYWVRRRTSFSLFKDYSELRNALAWSGTPSRRCARASTGRAYESTAISGAVLSEIRYCMIYIHPYGASERVRYIKYPNHIHPEDRCMCAIAGGDRGGLGRCPTFSSPPTCSGEATEATEATDLIGSIVPRRATEANETTGRRMEYELLRNESLLQARRCAPSTAQPLPPHRRLAETMPPRRCSLTHTLLARVRSRHNTCAAKILIDTS